MLEKIRGNDIVRKEDIIAKYPDCKFVLVDIDDDLHTTTGKLYSISHDSSS